MTMPNQPHARLKASPLPASVAGKRRVEFTQRVENFLNL
jgi:hypothetical protein